MKTKKMKLVTITLGCALAFACGGVITTQTANAATNTDLQMLKGASVRKEDNPGIRFTAYISDSYAESLGTLNQDYEVGMAIIPKSVADGIDGFNVNAMDEYIYDGGVQVKAVKGFVPESANDKDARAGYKMFKTSLVQIPESEEFWETEIIANAYVKVGNEYTFVTDFTDDNTEDDYENSAQVRDIAHVVAKASANGETGSIIDQIINVVSVGETLTLTANKTSAGNVVLGIGEEKTAQITATTTSGYAVKWTSVNTIGEVTVDENGTVTGEKAGYATVQATFGANTVSQQVIVYQDEYDFENGETSGLMVFRTGSAGNVSGYTYDTAVDESFGDYGFKWLTGTSTSFPDFYVLMDCLDYGFSDPNVAYFAFDMYLDGMATNKVRRATLLEGTNAITPSYSIVENQVYINEISRTEYEVMKTKGGDVRFYMWSNNATDFKDVNVYLDNARFVTYDDLHTTNEDGSISYGFEDGAAYNGIVYNIDASNCDMNAYSIANNENGVTNNALKMVIPNNWVNYGISADYLRWVFEVKNAKTLSFDVLVKTNNADKTETYLYTEAHGSNGRIWAKGIADGATSLNDAWGTITFTKANYENMKNAKANATTADVLTLTHKPKGWAISCPAGIRFRVNNTSKNDILYVDNFVLNF